jgi:hypothetical protein
MPGPKSRRILRTCEVCIKQFLFQPAPSRIRNGCGKYCSKSCSNRARRLSLEVRFLLHFGTRNGRGCVEWSGSRNKAGYGVITCESYSKKQLLAHRVSWEIHVGKITNGLCVLHRCDNPSCVNPEHLFLGTCADNNADRAAKGRSFRPAGDLNPMSKLSQQRRRSVRGV